MNTLYGILTWGTSGSSDYAFYDKRHDMIVPSNKMLAIRDIVMTGIPDDKKRMFAAFLCDIVRYTNFGSDILKLDDNNTYVPITRPTDADHSDSRYCLHGLIKPASAYRPLLRYLDTDITGRMIKASFTDWMGAACLQLLREVAK